MKKEYQSPVAEQVPLLMDQSVCQMSTMKYILITDPEAVIGPTVYDLDSD